MKQMTQAEFEADTKRKIAELYKAWAEKSVTARMHRQVMEEYAALKHPDKGNGKLHTKPLHEFMAGKDEAPRDAFEAGFMGCFNLIMTKLQMERKALRN